MATRVLRLNSKRYFPWSNQVLLIHISGSRSLSSEIKHREDEIAYKVPPLSSEPANWKRGTGGRSSFSGKVATVFGATGLLGRAVVNQLGKIGTQLILPYRGDHHAIARLKLCGDLGQVLFQHYNLKDEESIYKAMKYSNVVINLIGRNFETSNFPFEEVHVNGPRRIARIARESGVQTLIHVSALNACEKPKPVILRKGSGFYASKWRGEQAVREEFPEAIIFRPSDMWGQNDQFLFYYATWWRRTFARVPLWKKGKGVIKQPVFYSNVAKGILRAALDPACAGTTFQAVGPFRYELHDLVDYFFRVMKRNYPIIDLRFDLTFWFKLFYSELMFTRHKTISWERMEREYTTDIVDPDIPTLEDLGVELTPIEQRIFYELKAFRGHAYLDPMLRTYVRPLDPPPLARG